MKMFLWEKVSMPTAYHTGFSRIIIFAENLERAKIISKRQLGEPDSETVLIPDECRKEEVIVVDDVW